MPAIGATQLFAAAPPFNGNAVLYTTLALALLSFLCSVYTTLRTLLPLLAAHPLARRRAGVGVGPATEKRVRLKSAQRFTTYLAIADILAACILVWEAAAAATATRGLGGTKGGASRLYLACTARPTLLLVVAVLSYVNVVQGRSIALGAVDWIVWAPALALFILGAGLASLAPVGGVAVWVGLIVWLTVVTAVVSICFGRLLIAILRVRKTTRMEEKSSPWGREQERVVGKKGSSAMGTLASYLPPYHSNFSGLSTSFIGTIGRSTSTLDLSVTSHDVLPYTSSNAPGVGYAPSSRRLSIDSDQSTLRDVRSPTPGSTMGLLAGLRQSISNSRATTPIPSPRFSVGSQDHEIITFEEVELEPRPSMGSFASSSTFNAGGFVGGTAMRQAIVQEVWGSSPAPGTGHSPKVELSKKEARGAMVRIGGHLFGCLMGYALITPYLFIRVADPPSAPPLFATMLLIIGVCQPGFILSWQCASSEGFWYRTENSPVLTSSSATNLDLMAEGQPEMVERPGSAASSYYAFKKSHSTLPGIQPDGEDAVETRMGRVGRALSMVQPHPKLLILPSGTDTSSTSGAKTSQGHTRLRSLTLTKTVLGDDKKPRKRSGIVSSRKTFAGFEMRSMSPMLVHRDDEAITRSLLATRKPMRPTSFAGTGRVPFGFGHANGASRSTPDLVAETSKLAPAPSPSTTEFAFRTEDLTLPPLDSTAHSARSPPPDYTIDFLSSQVLPRLVPSVIVGRSTVIESEDAPLNRRRSSLGTTAELNAGSPADISRPSSRASRNIRNLSLPSVLQAASFSSKKSKSPRAEDTWVSVDEQGKLEDREPVQRAKTPESVIASITSVVRGKAGAVGEDKSLRRRSWKDRTAKAWDRVEQKEQAEGTSSSRRVQLEAIEDKDPSFLRAPTSARRSSFGWSLDSPIAAEETEVLEEEGNVADESEGDDDEEAQQAEFEAHRRRRSVSPMSLPTSPIHEQHFDESVVLRGSQFIDEDAEVGTVHCATIHPISRPGSDHSDLDSGLGYLLRPTHIPTGSLGSNRSLATSSITSVGFQNQLLTGSWHARDEATTATFSGSDSDLSSANETSRRSSAALRPLSLLSQRTNIDRTSSASDTSEREMRKIERHQVASTARAPNAHGIPLPPIPIPATIIEDDEDKCSGEPTPRAHRQRTASTPREGTRRAVAAHLSNLDGPTSIPMSSTPPPPSRTPPHITSRTRARRQQRSRDVSSAEDNENVPPASLATTQPLRLGGRAVGGALLATRSMR